MTDFTQEIQHLQKLSCISLTPDEEKKLGAQLSTIIDFLAQLPQAKDVAASKILSENVLTLRTIKENNQTSDGVRLLKNVHHPIINNSIVIKSAVV